MNASSHRIAKLNNNMLFIYFNENDTEASRAIKSLTNRRYHRKQLSHWTAPITMDNVKILTKSQFTLSKSIKKWKNSISINQTFDPNFHIKGLTSDLKPYQLEGIQLIDKHNGRCLLADDPGLGKTVETIAWCHWRKKNQILIICPAFAKFNWEDEIKYWIKENDIQIIQGMKPTNITAKWVIVNYEVLLNQKRNDIRKDLYDVEWDVCLIDECHYISNYKALRTLAVQTLVENIPHVIPISATPGKNRPSDLFTSLNIVNDKLFPSFFKYAFKFCDPKKVFGGWEFKGATNTKELHKLLTTTIMIRRTKNEIFDQLPKRIRIPVLLEGGKEVESTDFDFSAFEKMKQAAVKAKMPLMIKWIKNMLKTEDKLIVFGEHKHTIDTIHKAFKDISVVVDGRTPTDKRKEAVTAFQRCKKCGVKKEFHERDTKACKEYVVDLSVRIFIGSRAAKESGTLTAAHHTVFTEFWWSVEDHKQAEDRAFGRAGDLHGTTNWYLIAKDTIEEHIAQIISLKDEQMSMTINGKEVSKNLLMSTLINKYKRRTTR